MKLKMKVERARGYQFRFYDHGTLGANPEYFGLEEVARISYGSFCKPTDTRAVWRDSAGKFWTARSADCPEPFKNTSELDRLFGLEMLLEEYNEELAARWDSAQGAGPEALETAWDDFQIAWCRALSNAAREKDSKNEQ